MAKQVVISNLRCPRNHQCTSIEVCEAGAITQETALSLPKIDPEKCTQCEKCISACQMGAIRVKV